MLPFHSNSDVLEDQISFFSMFFFYKQETDYKLLKRMNEVKLSCVLLGNCLKEGGREVKH